MKNSKSVYIKPSFATLDLIERKIASLPEGTVVRLGNAKDKRITNTTIMLLNKYGVEYVRDYKQ
jgi:hypothetical protein